MEYHVKLTDSYGNKDSFDTLNVADALVEMYKAVNKGGVEAQLFEYTMQDPIFNTADYCGIGSKLQAIGEFYGDCCLNGLIDEDDSELPEPPRPKTWGEIVSDTKKPAPKNCTHPNRFENVITATLRFWVCPDCHAEVDSPLFHKKDDYDDVPF